ncbi:MAG: lactate utilization protein [Planctomycetaceae bacterium]|jgi:L-lactate dehydrogenase complex protein LldF|nr:lactate utilization protein [Planctomycetaceae bacterium]
MSGAKFLKDKTKSLFKGDGPRSLVSTSLQSASNNLRVCWEIDEWIRWRQLASEIKRYVLSNLDILLAQFIERLESKGVKVICAKDADEANNAILEIINQHNAKLAVKGKSMVSEEIDLNHFLERRGITSYETDLGEFIVQLSGTRPSHIVTPALHLSAVEIGKLFEEKLNEKNSAGHEELTQIARRQLRSKFIESEIGFSGVNFGIAESGTLCICENEGNIGLSTSSPKVHIAMMGIEKLLPRLDDLPLFLNMLARMGTGQKLTTYTHFVNAPAKGTELYVVLVDNGRTRALADVEFREILKCMRCGLCMNNCPVFRQAGGWAYGWIYPGPLGIVLTSELLGIETAYDLPFACSLCGACGSICPVKIDLNHLILKQRRRAIEKNTRAKKFTDTIMWKIFSIGARNKYIFKTMMLFVRIGIRLAPFLPFKFGKLKAWTDKRDLPKPKKFP